MRSQEELRLLIAVSLGEVYYLLCHEQIVMACGSKMACPQCGRAMFSLGCYPPIDAAMGQWLQEQSARAPP
ncbi:hypothetical protein [Novipirellula maiorica]|uniref:hypothetical protein n=1 Tax=Novipirellula maiorica TaxID=1265734 RepID=UPI000346796F|nr:hypothetical protein [Rhodopirellula maiorica]